MRRPRAIQALVGLAVGGVLLGAGTVTWAAQHYRLYTVDGASMQPGLEPGARIAVKLLDSPDALRRGDVVVFPDPGTWTDHEERTALGAPEHGGRAVTTTDPSRTVVKRVVGLPGEHVVCCTPDGALLVDGQVLDEPYVHPDDHKASATAFDVRVPPGTVWVLGDHRGSSRDSRYDPTGTHHGAIEIASVIGVVQGSWGGP